MDVQKQQWIETKQKSFVTVVSVGTENIEESNTEINKNETNHQGYVTILSVGETTNNVNIIEEEVLIYRLPGERLGFGLKFEGGTKAVEFVKRLFIQSCAPDSPASRVRSSWGKLIEGDEVLEIDSQPVNKMTRLDCVKCLKDSNVIIKLLIRHINENTETSWTGDEIQKTNESVILKSEEKINLNTPPPVPPRKVSRKSLKEINSNVVVPEINVPDTTSSSDIPLTRHDDLRRSGSHLQSPRSSGKNHIIRSEYSNRDRRSSDGSVVPPDAEIYIDLFSQESTYSLSESDETGSSISTVVDRLSSYPTTSNSSFAGSGPSTPTAKPKCLNLSSLISDTDDVDFDANDILFSKLGPCQINNYDDFNSDKQKCSKNGGSMLLQPTNFQDAQLSYGNEDVKMMESSLKLLLNQESHDDIKNKPPLPPRRIKSPPIYGIEKNNNIFINNDENINDIKNEPTILPRLVDFVPKSNKKSIKDNEEINKKIIQLFIDNEKRLSNELFEFHQHIQNIKNIDNSGSNELQNWSPSSQLSTIGEDDEEEGMGGDSLPLVPIVIIESADDDDVGKCKTDSDGGDNKITIASDVVLSDDVMECPPSHSRQPPDGHEFPYTDYQETIHTKPICNEQNIVSTNFISDNSHNNNKINKFLLLHEIKVPIRDKIAMFSNNNTNSSDDNKMCKNKTFTSSTDLNNDEDFSKHTPYKGRKDIQENVTNISSSFSHNASFTEDNIKNENISSSKYLHARSQSLVDLSTSNRNNNWNLLLEQRRRGLSKLKGLVIPERIVEKQPTVDLPEIKINVPSISSKEENIKNEKTPFKIQSNQQYSSTLSLTTPPWNTSNSNNIPKYSPAFKRKSLQIYSSTNLSTTSKYTSTDKKQTNEDSSIKPLTNISSTQSECTFNYVNNYSKNVDYSLPILKKETDCVDKNEDESDNDSAVSSSQSNISKTPPASPSHIRSSFCQSCSIFDTASSECQLQCTQTGLQDKSDKLNPRLLKPTSVEAINRKNILASAKCRSGLDMKVESLMQNKKPSNLLVKNKIGNLSFKSADNNIDKKINTTNEKKVLEKITSSSENKIKKNISSKIQEKHKVPDIVERRFSNKNNCSSTQQKVVVPEPSVTNIKKLRQTFENFPTETQSLPINTFSSRRKKEESNKKQIKDIDKISDELINELDEGIPHSKIKVVNLRPEIQGGSVGVTLAGGADYEIKYITIHKIRNGSVACLDGRLKKGDKILAINGRSTKGLTHEQAVAVLKESVSPVTIIAYSLEDEPKSSEVTSKKLLPSILPILKVKSNIKQNGENVKTISLKKDVAGLGFSMEGGRDSLEGDKPLLIKKIFKGGAAEKCGELNAGNELLAINNVDVTNMTKVDAWSLMKKLPEGNVTLCIRR